MFTSLKEIAARLRAFARTGELDRDFDQELESHVTMLAEDNVRRGMTPDDARRAALIRVGGLRSIKEQHRDVRGLPAVDAVLQDLRFAFRLIGKDRWFSAVAIGVMALGIGVNAIGFTIVNGALFRGPFDESQRIHVLSWQNRAGRRSKVSHAELQDWRDQSRTFVALAAWNAGPMNISDDRAMPEEAQGAWITANAFGVARQQPLVGRDFAAGEDRNGAEPVVIVGYRIWKSRYGADPSVVGKLLRVNGRAATIVGVMPDGVRFPDNTDIWVPFIPTPAQEPRTARVLNVFGRLRDDVSRAEAQSELNVIGERRTAAYPDANKDVVGVRVETFTERFVGGMMRTMFLVVMGAVCFVLLIACANVANLQLARSAHRAREIAVRMALGASRWRVVRQLLLESVVLSLIGGTLGLLIAVAGVRAFDDALNVWGKPYWIVFTIDYAVLGYVVAICVVTAMLFGLAPAMHVSRTNNNDVLKEGGRGSIGNRRMRWTTGTMVVVELALTAVLLVGAGLMLRSFLTLYTVDIGVNTEHLMTMRLQLPEQTYASPEARRAFFERLEPRLAAIAGVESVAVTTGVPPLDGGERLLEIDRGARTADDRPVFVSTVTISPRFFQVVRVPLLRGRGFTDLDGAPGAETVIINERLAAQFFAQEDPIGRRLRFTQRDVPAASAGLPTPAARAWRTIVGVAPSIGTGSPQDSYVNAVVYVPYRQESPGTASLLLRSPLPPGSVMDGVRREVQAIDRDQPVYTIQTVEQMMAEDRWPLRVFGLMFGIFAVIALALSSVGLYAVMAYSVAQRTQEIGVRMALGAQARQVSWLVLGRGLGQLGLGLTLGLAGALALSRVLQRLLVGISPADPVTFAAITLLLTMVSMASCLLPARRATQVDPLVALRAD